MQSVLYFAGVSLCFAAILVMVNAGLDDRIFDKALDITKEGIKAATGQEVCTDSAILIRGIVACPEPTTCCVPIIGEPGCCNWIQKNELYVLIGAGVLGLLIIITCCACCCCCGCCCFRKKEHGGAVIVMQTHPPPSAYPNHPHRVLNEQA